MNNKTVSGVFKLYSQLMELHGENPFRIRAVASAAFKIDKLPVPVKESTIEELSQLPGIGKSTADKIVSILETGSFDELDTLISNTPVGVMEMLEVKGLGPKKIKTIWRDLQIDNIGELLYACNENRLLEAKGFGAKTQDEIKKSIEFRTANKGWFLYAKVEPFANRIFEFIQSIIPANSQLSFTGDYRRKSEILNTVDILVDQPLQNLSQHLQKRQNYSLLDQSENKIVLEDEHGFTFNIRNCTSQHFAYELLITTGSLKHLELLPLPIPKLTSETEIYKALGVDFIVPELREGLDEVELGKSNSLPTLIEERDLKGTLHNHSTYSDGVHSLSEMAEYCKNELKLEYLGICDHSKTAVYANGLSVDRVLEQWSEIDTLNRQLAPFKIFKGIESDILSDGSLDYPDEILQGFDFVVASIHSNLKMDIEKATSRLIRAIENPYTTILGHPTGRLLLSRQGYPIDYERVIDACAANKVVIEINSNPLRLDLDWRWHKYALEKGVLLSINPDAHRTEGLHDMRYGINIARKGGLPAENCLNAWSLDQLEEFFKGQ